MRWVAAVAICLLAATAYADWGARRDPFDAGVVTRFKAILARDPYDDGALRQLVAMYKRHRTVAKLEAEYRAQPESWAMLVVLARMPTADAVALWKRAVAIKPDDARAWIAIGDAAKSDATAARDAYVRAAKAATAPRDKRVALTKLVATARDADTIDGAYLELIAMAPKDGKLWLDRGNAQIAAKRFASANDSFAAAEGLLRTDPERRIEAMTSQGIALDGLGRADDAIAQYERTLDAVPRGYFMGQEVVLRIVETERKRGRLAAAIERFEKRWPERARGYFEWVLLGDLYVEQHGEERAIDAYQRAVAKAPTEVATQRKLIALLDKLHPTQALAQHEAAARVAPGDAEIQLELAKRYHPTQKAKALATLAALARRLSTNVNVRTSIAVLYDEWEEPARAISEYEATANLEPDEPDHALALGEAYWRSEQSDKARAAWKRLDKIGTRDAFFRHAEVLALHDFWADSIVAYSASLERDGMNVDALYGRARANEELAHYPAAIEDARRAVAMSSNAKHDDGLRNRTLLVRILGKEYARGRREELDTAVTKWRFAFEHGDIEAGYLLATHHERISSPQQHDVLVDLYRRAPVDDSLGFRVARSYTRRGEYAKAREELERIARRSPARAKDVAEMIERLDVERERVEREIRWEEEGERARAEPPDLVGRERRTGFRFELGTDVANTSGALIGFGLYRMHRVARGTASTLRFDWTKRDDDMVEHKTLALGAGITTRLLDTRRFELAAGGGARVELRYGDDIPSSTRNRAAIAGDVTLEMLPRARSATLGLRFQYTPTDPARSSTLLVELGFEVR